MKKGEYNKTTNFADKELQYHFPNDDKSVTDLFLLNHVVKTNHYYKNWAFACEK